MRKKSLIAALPLFAIAAIATAMTEESQSPIDPLFAADQGETRAVLMIRDGAVVAKRYAPGYSDETRFISWSMAKSVTAVLVGALVSDGKLSLDAPVPFAEWQAPGDPRAKITLRQMLHMSSGIDHTEALNPADPSGTLPQTLFVDSADMLAARGLSRTLEAKPGAKYEYSSITSLLLSELITRQVTTSRDPKIRAAAYKAFAQAKLFGPAGIKSAVLEFDGAGTQIGGSIIHMSLDDWGRFGTILLSGKGEDGSPLITPEWMAFLRTPSVNDPGYGGHVWLNRPRSKENARYPALFPGKGPDTLYSAVGHLGQYVIASPAQNLVLVRLGKTNDPKLAPVRAALGRVVAGVPLVN